MRKILLSLISVVAFSAAANAQSANWSGLYGGITGGYGWGDASQRTTVIAPPPPPPDLTDHDYSISGGTFGGALGYDFQAGPWVYGLLGDFSWADISGSTNVTSCGPASCGAKLRSFGTVRGRLGYATAGWLPYITGGFAFGNVSAFNNNVGAAGSNNHTGWTLGAGIEKMFAPNWSAKLEYLYTDLGSKSPYLLAPGFPESVNVKANLIRVGLNYHFNSSAPAPVEYPVKARPIK